MRRDRSDCDKDRSILCSDKAILTPEIIRSAREHDQHDEDEPAQLVSEPERWHIERGLSFTPRTSDAIPPQDSAREMWLLGEAGSFGRKTIQVEQYEELRALAVKLAKRFDDVRRVLHESGAKPCVADNCTDANAGEYALCPTHLGTLIDALKASPASAEAPTREEAIAWAQQGDDPEGPLAWNASADAPPLDLDALERAHKATTPGAWGKVCHAQKSGPDFWTVNRMVDGNVLPAQIVRIMTSAHGADDAGFIHLAHEKWPALLAEVRRLRAEHDRERAIPEQPAPLLEPLVSAVKAAGFRLGPDLQGVATLWCIECGRDSGFHYDKCSRHDYPTGEETRNDALEEAAKLCDVEASEYVEDMALMAEGAANCAERIRALLSSGQGSDR